MKTKEYSVLGAGYMKFTNIKDLAEIKINSKLHFSLRSEISLRPHVNHLLAKCI